MVVCGIIDRLAEPTVALAEAMIVSINENVRANQNLKEIVELYDLVEAERLPILHKLWSPTQNKVEINSEKCDWFERI